MKKVLLLFSVCIFLFATCSFARTSKDGFNKDDCETFTAGGFNYLIPKYFTNKGTEEYTTRFLSDESDGHFQITEYSSMNLDNLKNLEDFTKLLYSTFDSISNLIPVKIESDGYTGYLATFKCRSDSTDIEAIYAVLINEDGGGCLAVGLQGANGATDYMMDYYKIITSAEAAGSKTSNESDPETDSGEMSSEEFRKSMDDYKAFFEEYCAFMKKYAKASASDMTSMRSDYSEFMSKYQTAMNALESIDTSKLSPEDQKYYLDTLADIQKMLLEATQ